MTRRNAWAIVGALTVVNLALRWTVAFNSGLWRDEALFLGVVTLPSWSELLDFLRFHESHPPLFYALMRVWLGLTGASDTAALVPPVIFGALLVPAVFAAGVRIGGQRVGLIAVSLVAFLPSVIEEGSAVRPYSFLTLLVLGSVVLLVNAMDYGGHRRWLAHGASMAVLVYTHNWAWVVVAGMLAAAAVHAARLPERRAEILRGAALSAGFMFLAFLPWLGSFLGQAANAGHSGIPVDEIGGIASFAWYATLTALNTTVLPPVTGGRAILVASLAVSAAILLRAQLSSRNDIGHEPSRSAAVPRSAITVLAVTPLAAAIVAAALSPKTNLLVGRCLSTVSPIILIAIAIAALSWLDGKRGRGRRTAVLQALGATITGVYAAGVLALVEQPRSNAREVARELDSLYRQGDVVIIAPGWLKSSVAHYSGQPTDVLAFPDSGTALLFDFSRVWERMRDPAAMRMAERRIAAAADSGRRVWLVMDLVSRAPLTGADIPLSSSGVAWATAKVRAAELRRFTVETFGKPVHVTGNPMPPPRQETLVAELFERNAQ